MTSFMDGRCRLCDWLLDADGYCTNEEGPCWYTAAPQPVRSGSRPWTQKDREYLSSGKTLGNGWAVNE